MKRITFLADATNAHMEKWVFALQDSYEIQVITPKLNPNFEKQIQQVEYNQNPAIIFPFRQIAMIFEIYKIKKIIRAFHPHVIHVHFALAHPIFYSLPSGTPVITSFWGSDLVPLPGKSFSDKFLKYPRLYVQRSQAVTVTSKYLLGIFEKLFHKSRIRTRVIPFGIDSELFSPAPRPNQKSVVVGFARAFMSHYGFLDLLEACDPLMKEGLVVLKVAGNGDEEILYKQEVARRDLTKYVEFVGRIAPVTKMPDFYRSLDIFASPSHRESFGVAALEASSCGLPVVATKVGGLLETIENGVTGILVPAEDVLELRKAIRQLAESETLRKRMGELGREKVAKEYEWKKSVAHMKELYDTFTR